MTWWWTCGWAVSVGLAHLRIWIRPWVRPLYALGDWIRVYYRMHWLPAYQVTVVEADGRISHRTSFYTRPTYHPVPPGTHAFWIASQRQPTSGTWFHLMFPPDHIANWATLTWTPLTTFPWCLRLHARPDPEDPDPDSDQEEEDEEKGLTYLELTTPSHAYWMQGTHVYSSFASYLHAQSASPPSWHSVSLMDQTYAVHGLTPSDSPLVLDSKGASRLKSKSS
jgi:hypothetical protein